MEAVPQITPEDPTSPEASEQTIAAAPEEVATSEAAASEEPALPVPISEPQQRRSLWRRITRRRDPRAGEPTGFQDLVKSRLDGITLRLESFEHGLARSDARLESRFAQLERIEARLAALADLGERADQAIDAALQAAEASRRAASTARVAAGLAGIALVIAVATLTVSFN